MMMYQVLVERFADVEISLGGHNDHAVHAARQSNLQTGEVNTMSIKVVILRSDRISRLYIVEYLNT